MTAEQPVDSPSFPNSPFGYTARPGHQDRVEPTPYRMGLVLVILLIPMVLGIFWYLVARPAGMDVATSPPTPEADITPNNDPVPPSTAESVAASDLSPDETDAIHQATRPSAGEVVNTALETMASATVPLEEPTDSSVRDEAMNLPVEAASDVATELEITTPEIELLPLPAPGKERIAWVQQRLTEQGYRPGPIDGFWGQRTARALAKFQQATGLSATGELNEATLAALRIH